MGPTLGIFAKEPRPGEVKTRLAAIIGTDLAARLCDAFLRDLLDRVQTLPVVRVVAYTPPTGRTFFEQLVGNRFELFEQQGADIGLRMRHFFEAQFRRGASAVVLVGSDMPHLPVCRIEQAFSELQKRELVFGPCDDGGYYLIGMNRMVPEVFEGIDWSQSSVFQQTIRRIEKLPLRLTLLERSYDIDRPADVAQLAAEIHAARRAGRDPQLPHIEAVLRSVTSLL